MQKSPEPTRPLLVLSEHGLALLPADEITPSRVGWKAYGLAALPEEWVPPLFVIQAGALGGLGRDGLQSAVVDCFDHMGLARPGELIVRSSGIQETLANRGRLESARCVGSDVATTVEKLSRALSPTHDLNGLHWIVQTYSLGRARGHLSNERRLSYEKRDWVLEVESEGSRASYVTPVAVRKWRDGSKYNPGKLECAAEAQLSITLKTVALWAGQFHSRMHFEWVWNGSRVNIVQADQAQVVHGFEPSKIISVSVGESTPDPLKVFRLASGRDFDRYSKLRNAAVYRKLGYDMPSFYIIDDAGIIGGVLTQHITPELMADLEALTRRPLVVRTDGLHIPDDKREMLPRSEELRSAEDAVQWLKGQFVQSIRATQISPEGLVIIAHHFIPSIASAWASSDPERPVVRIEALWGIPEGLYWFSHDTYEVDTGSDHFDPDASYSGANFDYAKRIRYKGLFVAPDSAGRWITHPTPEPFDWNATLRRESDISEIAWATRRIAEHVQHPVAVMWFVETHPSATRHNVLPWYHMRFELQEEPRAAPRGKYRRSRDLHISSVADWDRVRSRAHAPLFTERLIIEPTDASLIRDPSFVSALAELAKERGATVELSGGVLSHAFYMLNRRGVRVECVDLFGQYEEVVEFDKLVRDKVPSVIINKGERAATVKLAGDALILALKRKLVEEAFEALDTNSGATLIEELADVIEVVIGLATQLHIGRRELEDIRKEKARRRGAFHNGIMLVSTGFPGSLARPEPAETPLVDAAAPRVITDSTHLPVRGTRRRPDARHSDSGEWEKRLSFELDLSAFLEARENLAFDASGENGTDLPLKLTVEVTRQRGTIKVTSSVTSNIQQFDFFDVLGA